MKDDDKIAILTELINMRSSVLKASLTMKLDGGDTTDLETADKKLEDQIQTLRGALHQDWQGAADAILHEVKGAGERVRRRTSDIESDINRAEKATEILAQVGALVVKIAPLLG